MGAGRWTVRPGLFLGAAALIVALGCPGGGHGNRQAKLNLTNDAGEPITSVSAYDSLMVSLSQAEPRTHYEFRVTPAGSASPIVGQARLSTDQKGDLPPALLLFDVGQGNVPIGSYDVAVSGPGVNETVTIDVDAPKVPYVFTCDSTGAVKNTFDYGDPLYAAGGNFPPNTEVHLTPLAHFRAIIEAPDAHLDASNIPLSEGQENRVAWLGTEIQSLDADLARAMGIADKTGEGMTGLMVTYVYEGSPAARRGLEVGDVLLRIHTREEPRPIELVDESYYVFDLQAFPWDQLDEIPEEYFDRIPPPWPPANGFLNKLLTDLGAGNDFSLEYLRDGDLRHLDMVVEYSPPYFRTASKVEHEELGVTVRDMTYEVRRCLQRTAADPGVIISTLAPGSRASVSGLRPYEIITHVNGEPVMNVADFARLASDRGEVRLAVRRFNSDRIVSITVEE